MKKLVIVASGCILAAIIGILAYNVVYYRNIVVGEANTATEATVTPSKYEVGPPDAQEMLELVNKERKKAGVAPLVIDKRLTKSAQIKADDMEKRKYFEHVSPDGVRGASLILKYAESQCGYVSENLVWNVEEKTEKPIDNTSQGSVDAWKISEPHYKAMLDPRYTLTGFGISGTYVVQHFCQTS